MIYILTAEPYHENSTILGATTDKRTALAMLNEAGTWTTSKGASYLYKLQQDSE